MARRAEKQKRKKRMKFLVTLCVLLLSVNVYAKSFSLKVHSSDFAAAGYADVASDGPSNKALDKEESGFTALSLDVRGTLSQGISAFTWIEDVVDFKNSLDSIFNVLQRYNELTDLISRSHFDLGASTRLDFMQFRITGKKLGYLSIGAYAESSVGIIVRAPRKEDIKIVETWLDIGKDTNVLVGAGRANGGLEILYGRSIPLPHRLKLGVGIQNRVFYRFTVPDHIVIFNKELREKDDITVPDFTHYKGWGFGTDLYTSLDLNDKYLDTRFSIELKNVISLVWYEEFSDRDMVQIGIGSSISPFKVLKLEQFKIMADMEVYEDGTTAVHSGASWKFGNQRFHFTPCIGGALIGRDMWGNSYHSFTTGFTVKVAVLELAGVFEYLGFDRYDAGARVAVSW